MAFEAYIVSNRGPEKQRMFAGWFWNVEEASWAIRDAIASGFDYGYVKEQGHTVAYYTEHSFRVPPVRP